MPHILCTCYQIIMFNCTSGFVLQVDRKSADISVPHLVTLLTNSVVVVPPGKKDGHCKSEIVTMFKLPFGGSCKHLNGWLMLWLIAHCMPIPPHLRARCVFSAVAARGNIALSLAVHSVPAWLNCDAAAHIWLVTRTNYWIVFIEDNGLTTFFLTWICKDIITKNFKGIMLQACKEISSCMVYIMFCRAKEDGGCWELLCVM